jgi:hypothetical protein
MPTSGIVVAMIDKTGYIGFVVERQTMEDRILLSGVVLKIKEMIIIVVVVGFFIKNLVGFIGEIPNTTIITPPSLEPPEWPAVHEERDMDARKEAFDDFLFGGKSGHHLFRFQELRHNDMDLIRT